ncbi:MAG: hypothetical protein FJ000_05315 [Actinobacteria bacterium]|nr:hypothetical protein [Actinomycetota bacterium]
MKGVPGSALWTPRLRLVDRQSPVVRDHFVDALDVIADVGPRGHYLNHQHARSHVRGFPLPMRHRGAGHDSAEAAANAELARLEREHEPEQLPADVLAELKRIPAEADGDAERLAR